MMNDSKKIKKYNIRSGVRYDLRGMREAMKITRDELIKLSGVGEYKIKMLEAGRGKHTLSDLQKISDVFKSLEEKILKDIQKKKDGIWKQM